MRRVRQVGDRERELRSHIRQLFAGVGFRRFHDGLDPAATLRKEIAANGDASAVALAAFGRELKPRLDRLLALPEASRAHWGIKIVSLDTGKTLYSLDERKLFTPASNTKLFTTALALATLGPDFRFHTTVEAAGPPDKHGRVAGDVWLMGRGDPNLSGRALTYTGRTERDGPPPRALDALADQLVSRGLRYVDGDLVADDTYFVFERFGEGWSQNDLVWGYAAPVSALAINDNALFLQVLPGEKPGDPAQVKLDPPELYYRVQNRVRTVEGRGPRAAGAEPPAGRPRILVNREPGEKTLEVWGTIPADDPGGNQRIAVDDPAEFAGRYFSDALARRGVVLYGQVRPSHCRAYEFDDLRAPRPVPPGTASRYVLAGYDSQPLADGLKVVDKDSQNLHAEMLLRTVARELRGIGSVAAGLEEMKTFLARAGVPEGQYVFYDGSGLSWHNLVSPSAVVALLKYMERQPLRGLWRDLLPVAGVDGTLRERLKDTAAAGRIQAKTGTLSHVNALSGYATTGKGERLVFSILVNNHNLRGREATAFIDRICPEMIDRSQGKGRARFRGSGAPARGGAPHAGATGRGGPKGRQGRSRAGRAKRRRWPTSGRQSRAVRAEVLRAGRRGGAVRDSPIRKGGSPAARGAATTG
jgi:D-alanyl-D-alanine carboxypeptidase/D-alanyl-D-alanine-endopeptidase (penicillin-binding protein 4)